MGSLKQWRQLHLPRPVGSVVPGRLSLASRLVHGLEAHLGLKNRLGHKGVGLSEAIRWHSHGARSACRSPCRARSTPRGHLSSRRSPRRGAVHQRGGTSAGQRPGRWLSAPAARSNQTPGPPQTRQTRTPARPGDPDARPGAQRRVSVPRVPARSRTAAPASPPGGSVTGATGASSQTRAARPRRGNPGRSGGATGPGAGVAGGAAAREPGLRPERQPPRTAPGDEMCCDFSDPPHPTQVIPSSRFASTPAARHTCLCRVPRASPPLVCASCPGRGTLC